MTQNIDNILQTRKNVPPMSADLTQRIIAQTKHMPQHEAQTIWGSLKTAIKQAVQEMEGALYIPRPALSLALVLVVGLSIGAYSPSNTDDFSAILTDDTPFLFLEDSTNGEFL